ncbi:hypothetical protein MTR67_036958 [Solanum verrucosum]|uniref:Uncharacterized protein n=1 Tax=Solanum verrucosum TaxID=315347 RepID=A0AAF0UD00_SOLVR|nr:hypothetical protein MTR67_036958 [Solanum verrucosum]
MSPQRNQLFLLQKQAKRAK